MAALKLTFPTQLPKNEKDLICMLLAGRLKDLFKGKLICAQLALDDLLKDVAGVSALGGLQSALNNMKSALNGFKTVSGYDNILHGVNQALGQVNNVFSLGGLCPSPVRAPKIPDLLAQLNANMFGQANNILSSLGKLSNPSMCLGGGPKGFGINWNSMPGDLKNLKAAIAQAKSTGGGMTPALNAFASNLKSQTSRMKGEIKRLEKNLADPLGLNEKLSTAKNIQRVKSISDGYPVKDAKGILHPNVLKSMVPADIESTIDNGDRTPVKYVTKPILDYCGDVVGYEKVAVTGDPNYIGWDPNGDPSLNTDNPTVNPVAGYSSYTYTFKQEGSVVKVYDTGGVVVTDLKLSRGIAYRLGFELTNKQIKFYSNSAYTTVWTEGLTYSRNPEYGNDMEIILPDSDTTFVRGELDWSVLIENPTTPNIIYWKTTDGVYSGSFVIDGVTAIPLVDRTYDVSMAVKKACLQLVNVPATSTVPVNYETTTTSRTYTASNKIYNSSGIVISDTQTSLAYNQQYFILDDMETVDYSDNTDPNNKIIKTITKYNNSLYLITKRYVSIENGIEFNQIYFYRATGPDEATADYCILLKFDNPISILNSSKLPYTDNYSYKITRLFKNTADEFVPSMTPVSGSDETKFELLPNEKIIRWNLTSFTDKAQVPNNEFMLQTDIEIDPADTKRTFINSNPIESRMYFYFKFNDGSALESTITYSNSNNINITTTAAPSNTTTAAPTTTTTAAPTTTTTAAPPSNSYNGVELIPSGTNPTYWLYPVPTNQVYPTSATMTVSPTFIDVGETTEITFTWTFDNGLVALEPMEISIEDRSTHFGTPTTTIWIEPGQSSYSWTRPSQKFQWPASWAILTGATIPRYYDPRLPLPHSVRGYTSPTIRVSSKSKPILYDQTIACSLVAGQGNERQGFYGILETYTEGTALYDVHYYEDGEQYFVYRGGCRPPTTN